MEFNFLISLIFSLLFIEINSFSKKRKLQSSSEKEIQNGVYIIQNLESNLNLKLINSTLYFSSSGNKNNFDKFRFYQKEIKKENEYDNYDEDSQIFYYIEEKNSRKKLYFDDEAESVFASESINPEEDDKFLWEIKLMNYRGNLKFYEIKPKTKNKFIAYEESKEELTKAYCESSWNSLAYDRKSRLKIIKLYKENNNLNKNSDLLENEPIDVVIKYIDLQDKSLDRENFEQIDKDIQNNELKYSLRSIIQNIPWVRKIFIIMPNDNIPYLKEKEEIKDKIVYIKDNSLLGFDSSSPPTFQFNLHKLKKYDLSENFILMDDDYFIAQPLSKSDFFYEENGKIYPYIISTEYSELDKDLIKAQYVSGSSRIIDINYHSEEGFLFRKIETLLFLYKIFDNKNEEDLLIEVGFTHNAIPLKISDIEEIYEYIENKYQYYEVCLKGKKRNIRTLQPQILFMNYARNKYDRAVKEISWKYYDLSDARQANLNSKLFVINVEDKEYYPLRFKAEEEVLISLFPNPTKYEKEYDIKNKNLKKDSDINQEKNIDSNKNDNIDINGIINKYKSLSDKNDDKKEEQKEEQKDEKEEQKKEISQEVNKNEQKIEIQIEKKSEEKEKLKETEKKADEKKEDINTQLIGSNTNNNNTLNVQNFHEIERRIKSQIDELDKKYNKLLEELAAIKSSINNSPQDNSLLIKKFQEFNDAQIEMGKKLSSFETENKIMKQAQIELGEKISNFEKNKKNDEEKNLYDNLYEQNMKTQKKINDLSEEFYSVNNKLNEMDKQNGKKDDKINDIVEENKELKRKIKSYENEIDEWKKKIEKMENDNLANNNKNEKNEQRINKINYDISQIKESLQQLKEKKDEKKGFFDDNLFSYLKYFIIIILILVVIYFVYIKFFKDDEYNSQNVKHMKLSQQYSGYGGFSNNLM